MAETCNVMFPKISDVWTPAIYRNDVYLLVFLLGVFLAGALLPGIL
jgi:hypothetical protein